ncbi:hypothetical protein AMTR_s00078p00129630 [Amborella trichopoda]|uniref:TIR domain-containing protein n=1 Tax=Amborella trichopoda TaxID=13333 RepID=W1P8A3_AMBTC|nr:hypothetical protein AMTR_s00078p00129630 [Amborella trichopoda]
MRTRFGTPAFRFDNEVSRAIALRQWRIALRQYKQALRPSEYHLRQYRNDAFDEDMMQRWRDDLKQFADLSGWDMKNRKNEANLVQELVRHVLNKLTYTKPSNLNSSTPQLVGMNSSTSTITLHLMAMNSSISTLQLVLLNRRAFGRDRPNLLNSLTPQLVGINSSTSTLQLVVFFNFNSSVGGVQSVCI